MLHTLQALQSGKLIGSKTLKLACGLKAFPEAIIGIAETLEVLDLSDNQISELPESISKLKHLRILFFARNNFHEFPKILAKCPELRMIGFKSNHIKTIPEHAFPPKLHWLILTDNNIKILPKSIGDCVLLQKCALAGNLIEVLPPEMASCINLELLRVSANKLREIPKWLFKLPKLAWVAFGGNPATYQVKSNTNLEFFDWTDFYIRELLGEGASGLISKAYWKSKNKDVAIKVFKGNVTSDGLPEDEMEISIRAGWHKNLIPVLGKIKSHPENKMGLIMTLIDTSYINLGNPPSLETCTRDTFNIDTNFNKNFLLKIAKSMASVGKQLHNKGIIHGDFYAHNILVNNEAESLLGDFGAASFYNVNSSEAHNIERIEVRAYGFLLEDVLSLVNQYEIENQLNYEFLKLIADCLQPEVAKRPSFSQILEILNVF